MIINENCECCKSLAEQLDQLKAENEHLAEKEEEAKHYLEEAKKYRQLANSFEADFYNALSDKESNLLKKYKQALEEIREIITNSFDSCYVCNSKDSCEKCLQGEILQKCEVLNEQN